MTQLFALGDVDEDFEALFDRSVGTDSIHTAVVMFHTSVVKMKHLWAKYSVANSCNDLASRSLQVNRSAKRSSEPSLQAMLETSSSGNLMKILPPFAFFLVVVSLAATAGEMDASAVDDILLMLLLLGSDALVGECREVMA